VVYSAEHGNEHLGSINYEVPYDLTAKLLASHNDSAPWS